MTTFKRSTPTSRSRTTSSPGSRASRPEGGVVVGAAALLGAEVFEYSPREVKRAVTGNGAASKQQVQGMVRRLLALVSAPGADEADAAALALCHLERTSKAAVLAPAETR